MKPAASHELTSPVSPAVIAKVTADELEHLFPVPFQDLDPLQEPEPASAALVRFPSGHAVVVFGKETSTVTISLTDDDRAHDVYEEILDEVPIEERIQWVRDDLEREPLNAWREPSLGHSNEELYRMFTRGADSAFEELAARWFEPLERWSLTSFRRLDPDDVVQATLFEVYRTAPHVQAREGPHHPPPVHGPGPHGFFASWIWELLHHVGRRLTKTNSRFVPEDQAPPQVVEVDYETSITIHEVLDRLNPEQHQALELFFQGKTLAEIAREEHVSRKTAAARRDAGVQKILKALRMDRK